ncbi:hypothetical protein [Pseudofrankia asymbiotica]|uniref:Uncharacterized protein n=1 Tax=Pseudofrankia asymbiotica TaxID=1834516 RepID=A0A1V2HYZ7_9ACTN|nr:hypothetical protein [Pseudofrankia asymbiotica]ONH21845.1 hypothetical protein BL253_37640 [Pseudofrankia asymbiotica]
MLVNGWSEPNPLDVVGQDLLVQVAGLSHPPRCPVCLGEVATGGHGLGWSEPSAQPVGQDLLGQVDSQ